jgi:hypothetical protein
MAKYRSHNLVHSSTRAQLPPPVVPPLAPQMVHASWLTAQPGSSSSSAPMGNNKELPISATK